MEQGSSSAKSTLNASNQRRMRSFTDELTAIVNSSTQDFPSIPDSRDCPQTGASFSRTPLQGEMLAQFHGGNEDLSAAYMHSNLPRREQLFHANNAMTSGEEGLENTYDDQMMNRYNLSNFPVDQYHMHTYSSRNRGVQIGSSRTLVPFDSSMVDPSVNGDMYNAYWAAQAQIPLRWMRSQGIPYQINSPGGFDLGGNSPTTSALTAPFESSLANPFPSGIELGSGNRSPTTSAALKRKTPTQDDATPSSQRWSSSGRGFQRYSSSNINNDGRYTLYDRRYEEIGLPVDPHLRIFIATNGKGNGESSSRRND